MQRVKNTSVKLSAVYKLSIGVSVCVQDCLSCVALQWTGDLSTVNPASRPVTAGGLQPPNNPARISWYNEWMDG